MQKIISDEDWPLFMKYLREPLPTTFRLAGSRECVIFYSYQPNHDLRLLRTAYELNNIIRNVYVPQLSDVTFEGVKIPAPVQLPWSVMSICKTQYFDYKHRYPDGLAWHLNVPKAVLRKSPEFKKFHNFLVYETDVVCTHGLLTTKY